jgi:tRNA(Ile)-lysidine synthase
VATVLDLVQRTIEEHHLLTPGETVVVGVSGGPDSLCLLHVLCRFKEEYDLTLHVAHLHHGLRGADADADADYVRALAADWRLACTVEQEDVPALARQHRLAFEEAARRARYSFLSGVASAAGAQTVAVGHNADDQAETVLMHFIRGSGLAGLRGMLAVTPLEGYRLFEGDGGRQATDDVSRTKVEPQRPTSSLQAPTSSLQIIRPLLEVTRAEIEAYCDRHGLEPRFDRSNLDTTYFRNWLRHEVLPLLAQHNPNVREVMRRCARVITDDYALLRSLLDETWPRVVLEESPASPPLGPVLSGASRAGTEGEAIVFDLDAWRALPTALQRSTLREAIHRLRRSLRNINFLHVENALLVARDGTTGDQATLPQGLMLTVGYGRFTMADAGAREVPPDWPLLQREAAPLPVNLPGDTALPDSDWILRMEVLGWDDLTPDWAVNPDRWQAFLDADMIGPLLWLRTRRPGDRFQPQGMEGHSVKLTGFFTNQKVPRTFRDRLPLLVERDRPQGGGGIVWICGWRVDERARVRDETERVLVARFVRLDSLSY